MKYLTRIFIGATLLTAAGLQAQTADKAPIQLQGEGPYYRLRLPLSIFERATFSGLDDVRVRNAGGLEVPMAWADALTPEPEVKQQAVPIFAVPVATVEPASLPVVIRADGSLGALREGGGGHHPGSSWLMDLSKVQGHLLRADFEIPADARGLFLFELDASPDLKHWTTIRSDGQLLRLSQRGELLERLSLDLLGVQARYLRLRWRDGGEGVRLNSANVESMQEAAAVPAPEWLAPIAPTHCEAHFCDYRLPRHLAAQALRINLAEVNTLARVEVIGLQDPAPQEAPGLRRKRHVLSALRHSQQVAAPPSNEPLQQPLFSTTVFRLKQTSGEALSDDLSLPGEVFAGLRVRTTGPLAQLGSKPPSITVAAQARTLIFLAQGQAPYTLAWVTAPAAKTVLAASPVLSPSQLLQGGKPVPIDTATVELPVLAPAAAVPQASAAMSAPPSSSVGERRVWLWAVLGLGLALLGLMARSLLRSAGKDADSAP